MKNFKRALVVPALAIMTLSLWALWFVMDIVTWFIKCLEEAGDKFFKWTQI